MNTADTVGVDALYGDVAADQIPAIIWDQMIAELGEVPEAPHIDPFDEQPWEQLPTMEDLEKVWLASPLLDIMVHKLATGSYTGPDLPQYMAQQRWLADMELELKKGREASDVFTAEAGGSVANVAISVAEALGGGRPVSGAPAGDHRLGRGRKARVGKNAGRASKVSGGRGSGNAD